jgi:hypothetical protein
MFKFCQSHCFGIPLFEELKDKGLSILKPMTSINYCIGSGVNFFADLVAGNRWQHSSSPYSDYLIFDSAMFLNRKRSPLLNALR